ncbi:MAG TPA: FtsX-like permease family protein [Sedimentisphaerales bacterium]|nr:FtsX-like permease family protein [Sedimentisphaerales bacterium]HNU29533.1 FtsX-like permease family protein [Sedimentisphaerales bacterium]
MVVIRMVWKEMWHRKVNWVLAVLAVTTAVAFSVAFFTAAKASERETARLMLSMGYNVHVIAKDADAGGFLINGIPDKTMPADYLDKLAAQQGISYNHLLATLEGKMNWRGMDIVLTGIAPEVCPPGQKKQPMTFQVEPGMVYVGYRIAESLRVKEGETLSVGGRELKVKKCLSESGGLDDMRMQCSLGDAQEILNQPGRITGIKAVDCLCFAKGDPVVTLRKEIGAVLPEAQVLQVKAIASARARQRQMVHNIFALMLPFVVAACGVWIGVLAAMNVRDRQQEIGLLRALGYDARAICLLFLGKAVLVGLAGAGVGFLLGTSLGLTYGPDVFEITAKAMIRWEPSLLAFACILAPLFAVVASVIPTMIAVTYDPAATLREE